MRHVGFIAVAQCRLQINTKKKTRTYHDRILCETEMDGGNDDGVGDDFFKSLEELFFECPKFTFGLYLRKTFWQMPEVLPSGCCYWKYRRNGQFAMCEDYGLCRAVNLNLTSNMITKFLPFHQESTRQQPINCNVREKS